MRLCLHAYAPSVVPSNDAGIVVEHRKKPINVLLHVVRWLHDVGFEQRINDGVFAGFMVDMVNL